MEGQESKPARLIEGGVGREICNHQVNGCTAVGIRAVDQPGPGGACHRYMVDVSCGETARSYWGLKFQEGPVREVGANGITNEALLAVVIDRLRGFQSGPFSCSENETALNFVTAALDVLKQRTLDRIARGVVGTNQA